MQAVRMPCNAICLILLPKQTTKRIEPISVILWYVMVNTDGTMLW
jgi:hypothetical protein